MIDDGNAGGVVKISNLGEDPAVLDLETAAILHIGRADPDLPVARPQLALGLHDESDPASYRPTTEGPEGRHFVRLFERMPGRAAAPGSDLDDRALRAYGETLARLGIALRGFFHPRAGRTSCGTPRTRSGCGRWCLDPRSAASRDRRRAARPLRAARHPRLAAAAKPGHPRRLRAGQRAARRPRPGGRHHRLRRHRPQRPGDRSRIVAVLACCAPATRTTSSAPPGILIDGFQSRVALEQLELELLPDLLAARLCTIVSISAWRVISYPENAEYIQAWDPGSWMLLNLFDRVGIDTVAQELGAERPRVASAELAKRRRQALGSAITALTYSAAGARTARRGPVAVRCRRPQAARRLQQRPRRRPLPPAGDRGRRPPDPDAEHARPLPVRAADGPRRAADRRHARRQRPGHGGRGQLGQRGERPGVADRQGVHRRVGRAGHGLRLSRRDHGDRRGLARGVARRLPAARRRDGRRRRHHPAGRRDGCRRRPPARSRCRARRGVSSTAGSPATACALRLPQTSPPWSTAGARRAGCSWPTRCRPDTGARATTCGRSRVSGSPPTSSRWASRWATAIRSPR